MLEKKSSPTLPLLDPPPRPQEEWVFSPVGIQEAVQPAGVAVLPQLHVQPSVLQLTEQLACPPPGQLTEHDADELARASGMESHIAHTKKLARVNIVNARNDFFNIVLASIIR